MRCDRTLPQDDYLCHICLPMGHDAGLEFGTGLTLVDLETRWSVSEARYM